MFNRTTVGIIAFVCVHVITREAPCQTTNAASSVSQEDYDNAIRLCKDGHYADAIPILERAASEPRALAARLQLATCLSTKGEWLKAISISQSVVDEANVLTASAQTTKGVKAAQDRAKWAREILDDLQNRVPKVQIILAGKRANDSSLKVYLDKKLISRTNWGQPLPTDPGAHRVVARIDDAELSPIEVHASAGITYPVQILVPEKPTMVELSNGFLAKLGGFSLSAVGVGLLITSGALGKQAWDKQDESDSGGHPRERPNGEVVYDEAGERLRMQGRSYGWQATWFGVGGAAAIVGGIALIRWGSRLDTTKPPVSKKVTMVVVPWGIEVAGHF